MHTLLKSHSADPLSNVLLADKLEAASVKTTGLSPGLRQKLLYMHVSSFDWEGGGLKSAVKFIDRDSIEYSLSQAALCDKNEERMAKLSLIKGMDLLDPDNGGIYQFATHNCGQQCLYSKTMAAQAGSLRVYSLAYALLREHSFLTTARNICAYLRDKLLTPEGAFLSVCPDSMVLIDQHKSEKKRHVAPVKTRENGWAIEALASCNEFCGEQSALDMAEHAAAWMLSERKLYDGGFSSENRGHSPIYLSDNLAMARAFLQLYRTTTERRYLRFAEDNANFICSEFINANGGFNTGADQSDNNNAVQQIDENICASRFFNLLHYYCGKSDYLDMARHGLRYLAIPQIATSRMEEAGILLLDQELSSTPLKIIIIGDKNDRKAMKLLQTALRTFGWYKVIQWQDSPVPPANSLQ